MRRPFNQGDKIVVRPTHLGARGEAEALYEGFRVRVQDGIPGEEATVRILHVSKGGPVAVARYLGAAEPHPARREPPCPIHRPCGGCGLQHMTEDTALGQKIADARRQLEGSFKEPIKSPRAFGYRAKAFLLTQVQKGRLVLGARPPRGDELVDTSGCAVLRPEIEAVAAAARGILEPGSVRTLMMRSNRNGDTQVTLVHRDKDDGNVAAWARRLGATCAFTQRHDAPGNRIHSDEPETQVWGQGPIEERFDTLATLIPPTAFCQGNPDVAEALYREIARRASGASIIELYCGTGVAGLLTLVGDPARRLLGVDKSPRAIRTAAENARKNGLESRCEFRSTGAEETPFSEVDTIIVNPPRAGCTDEVLSAASRSRAHRFLYLSCNAATLSRDAARLANGGWALAAVTPADMFPQTPHLELLAEFGR